MHIYPAEQMEDDPKNLVLFVSLRSSLLPFFPNRV